jgi:hypothetical protein
VKKISKKPLSKSNGRNRRVQFNMSIGQIVEEPTSTQQRIPENNSAQEEPYFVEEWPATAVEF